MNSSKAEGFASFRSGRTWYGRRGRQTSGQPALLVVHGGPGLTHDYLLDLEALADEREVIFYDQIGNGRSAPLGQEAAECISLDYQVAELANLLQHLGIAENYVLFAHSAGGCLALEHAITQPRGLKGLVLANCFPSGALMQAGLATWRAALSPAARDALEQGGASTDAEHAAAMGEFFSQHVCRVTPPGHLMQSLSWAGRHPQVQQHMMGTNLFAWTGELANWSALERLAEVTTPALAYGGRWDEASPQCLLAISEGLPACRSVTFERSSHLPHIEEQAACLATVRAFLGAL
jgi:L-proline amide hydrolase